MKQKRLEISWFRDFKCTGDKCRLTCCVTDWQIKLLDNELEAYKKLKHPYGKEILKAIDFEKKCFKGDENYRCLMLTEEGLCKIVQNIGTGALSATCQYFPREMYINGDILEDGVEAVCPEVGKMLFSSELPSFRYEEYDVKATATAPASYNLYDSLAIARNFLINMFMAGDAEEVYGKIFLLLDMVFELKKLIERRELTPENTDELCSRYDNEELIGEVCGTIRRMKYDREIEEDKLFSMFALYRELFKSLILRLGFRFKGMEINRYLSDFTLLTGAVNRLIALYRKEYSPFLRNYMINKIFLFFIPLEEADFGNKILNAINELFIIQIFAAMKLDDCNELSLDDYTVIIAQIDRYMAHSSRVTSQLRELNMKLSAKDFMDMVMF